MTTAEAQEIERLTRDRDYLRMELANIECLKCNGPGLLRCATNCECRAIPCCPPCRERARLVAK